jgi:uncharacterized protein YdcH (DUF465 family)
MDKGLDGRDEGGAGAELDGLQQRHQELERRLAVLERHLSLTLAEQGERARLKKEKLLVKDRILVLTARGAVAPRPH